MYHNLISMMGKTSSGDSGGVSDSNAQAFLTATGITDETISAALNQHVIDLKTYGIWPICRAIYPWVGGTAFTHKFNLKDPRDLDEAFRIVWNGSIAHNSNGITPDGSSGYGNTKLIGSTEGLNNDSHLSVYSRTNNTGNQFEIGTYDGSNGFWGIKIRDSTNIFVGSYRFTGDGFINVENEDSIGFYIESRSSASLAKVYRDGGERGSCTTTSVTIPSSEVCIGMRGTSSPASFSSRNLAYASIGHSLDDSEASNFAAIEYYFQSALGRAV
jgi:hypothetical protein